MTAFDPSGIRLTKKLGVDANLCGITKLSHSIYVLVRNPSAIHVFLDQKSFPSKAQIQIQDIKKPHDIAAAEKQNCLYVTDSETTCVWQITTDYTITKWLSNIGDPFTLYMTPNSHLVMARQGRPSKIEIYKQDASLDFLVTLPINIEEPLHAVENSDRNFVVSHKWRECGARETVWSISVLNIRGEILHRLLAKDQVQCLKDPQYLSVDSVNQVLVADFGNGRVVLLNSDLSWNRSLEKEDKEAIMYPKKLYLDSEGRQLLVGQYLKKGVHVYTF